MPNKKKTSRGPSTGFAEVLKIIDRADPAELRALFSFDTKINNEEDIRIKFNLWARFFFVQYFKNEDAPFHKEWDTRRVALYCGAQSALLNIAFRDSAKTTRAKLFRAFAIANDVGHSRRYYRVLSKDIGNAEQTVTDIYNMLISANMRVVYPEIFAKTDSKREERMSSFTTATGVKMIADTIGTDKRGAIQDDARPDFDLYDDFETRLSLMSAITTNKIWATMQEAQAGLAVGGASEYTCNYISERGNVHKLFLKIENKIVTPICDDAGEPTWSRYTKADIARLKKETDDFEGEYLCKPSASKDVYFDRTTLEAQKVKTIIDEVAGLKIYRAYDPANRVCSGHDVAGGVGLDSSTSVFLDLDVLPVQVIATYHNNTVKPDAFAHVIAKQGKMFGYSYAAIEKNYGSTLDILKTIYPVAKIHKTYSAQPKIEFQAPKEYGWDTNAATKPAMLSDLAKAVEDGLIELNDPDLIQEMKSYTTGDLMDRELDPRLTTRHFDLLMAAAIAWAVRSFVRHETNKNRNDRDPWLANFPARQTVKKINRAK